jgi:hypothetical protein
MQKTSWNDVLITIDVDWAPEVCIREAASALIKNNVKATWFITHESKEISRLKENSQLFELGIHPNFNKGSTHGSTFDDIVNNLFKVIPKPKTIRTHSLFQSSPTLQRLRADFNIENDVSLLLPHTPNLVPHELYLTPEKPLLRFPFFWEDDEEMNRPNPCFSLKSLNLNTVGLKIFNFHPIHIALNSNSIQNYNQFKKMHNEPLASCQKKHLKPYINKTIGAGTFFVEIIEYLSNNSSKTISDLAMDWKESL